MDVLNQPLELMVQHEQFQLIEELPKGYKKNNVTVPKAPAPIEVRVTVALSNNNTDSYTFRVLLSL
jgi:hypothetical protein